jgi:hypothetical protein
MTVAQTPEPAHVDMQAVSDDMAGIYEVIATLEHGGREPSRSAIAAETDLPDPVLDQNLAAMAGLGLLTAEDHDGEAVYAPARRGWSVQPDQAEGQKLS